MCGDSQEWTAASDLQPEAQPVLQRESARWWEVWATGAILSIPATLRTHCLAPTLPGPSRFCPVLSRSSRVVSRDLTGKEPVSVLMLDPPPGSRGGVATLTSAGAPAHWSLDLRRGSRGNPNRCIQNHREAEKLHHKTSLFRFIHQEQLQHTSKPPEPSTATRLMGAKHWLCLRSW